MVAHARIPFSINLLKKLLVHGTAKLISKFGEDLFVNDVIVLSTDAGDWTSDIGDRTRHVANFQVILYLLSNAAMQCIGQTKMIMTTIMTMTIIRRSLVNVLSVYSGTRSSHAAWR